jgi:TolB-like protein/class 3 adenylate cyclase/Tfp pilus assembly protein PilF
VAQGRTLIDRGVADRSKGPREVVGATETRRLAAILAADVAGYSRLMGADEEGTLQRLRAHRRELVDPKIREHRGRIVKTTGDGMLVEFPSVVDAVRCAVEVQRAMVDRNAEILHDKRITFRIGVNLGDVIADGDDIYGDGVNIAARLEALAEPGGICISRTVRDHIGDRLPYVFDDIGEQNVKNIAQPVHAFAVSAATVASLPEVAVPAQPSALPRRSTARLAVFAGSLVAVIGIGLAAWWAWPKGNPAAVTVETSPAVSAQGAPAEAKAAPPLSLVVLPFANLSNDPEQEYFADGITDDLTTDLSRFPGSLVIARNTAFTYKGKPTDVKQIGRDLGVRYVVEGSVRRTGDQVQVNVQLIDTESGAHLWADRFDADRRDLANAQAEITVRLARSLNVKLVSAEVSRSEQRKALDPDARDFVMRGWDWLQRPRSPTTLKEARQAFEHALEIDPRSNDARIGLARTLTVAVTTTGGSVSEDISRAEQLLVEAIEHDPNSSLAHEAMGQVRLLQKNRLHEAQIELETALALDRNLLPAVRSLGWLYAHLAEPEACIAQAERTLRLSPRDPWVWNSFAQTGYCHLFLNHVDLATDYLMKARAAAPQVWWVHMYLAAGLGLKGNLDAGRASLAESLKLRPEMNSIANFRDLRPWYSSPKELELEDHTVIDGLRRLGFPES